MVNFPAPVGGTPLPADFAPSILFAALYGLLLPLMVYRLYDRRSRTLLIIGTIAFSVERIVIFALRAVQSRHEARRFSPGLTTYMQVSFALGFIGIANDLVGVVRCILINPTYGSETYNLSPAANTKGGVFYPPPAGTPDQPRLRFWLRRFSDFLGLSFLAATVPGIVANSQFKQIFDNQSKADATGKFRIVSAAVALAMCIVILAVILWTRLRFRGTSRRGAAIISSIATLMSMVAIYRLSVMSAKTTSLRAPTYLDKPIAKAAFYVFHALPEWLAIFIFLVSNVRKSFGTGLAGDWRGRDIFLQKEAQSKTKAAEQGHEVTNGTTLREPKEGVRPTDQLLV